MLVSTHCSCVAGKHNKRARCAHRSDREGSQTRAEPWRGFYDVCTLYCTHPRHVIRNYHYCLGLDNRCDETSNADMLAAPSAASR